MNRKERRAAKAHEKFTAQLTVKQILLGNDKRVVPDPIDELCLLEYEKAGDRGLTSEELCERLLGRPLTTAEVAATDYADEADRTAAKLISRSSI
jgi:hypothetical protein